MVPGGRRRPGLPPGESKITFPLLFDSENRTIEAYHLRNNAAKGKAVGVPHPATFVVDGKGVIRANLILENFRERHSNDALIKAAKAID